MNNNQVSIEDLVKRCTRKAIRLAQEVAPCIDPQDAVQTFALAAIEAVGNFNPADPRCATIDTYALACYRNHILREAAQARYGVELDATEEGSEFVPGGDDIEALSCGDDQPNEEENEGGWRSRTDDEVRRRVALLPRKLRNFATEILSGKTVAQAAAEGGTCDRNGRYQLNQIREFMQSIPTTTEQGVLFS